MGSTTVQHGQLRAILQKLENTTSEVALSTPRRPNTLRRDVVQSNDNETLFFVVDMVQDDPVTNGDDTQWKILFPTDNSFGIPITTDPLYFLVFFDIRHEFIQSFIDLIIEEGIQVHHEEVNKGIRFDLWQSVDDPTKFVVLEVVQDWEGIQEHHGKPYYQKVRHALVEMQANPSSHDKGYKVLVSKGHQI